MQTEILNTSEIVERAEKIYTEKYKAEFEAQHGGKYLAIDITDGAGYLGDFSEIAMQKAKESSPHGVFHLIRIGASSSFHLGYLGNQCFNLSTGCY